MSWVINMPPGAYLLLIAVGLALIWWDVKSSYSNKSPVSKTPSDDLGTLDVLPAKAGIIVETSLLGLPKAYPETGWIDGIDFVPCMRRLETSKGAPGSRLRFLPDNFETTATYRMRITLASESPIYGVDLSFSSDYYKSDENDPHAVVFIDNPPEFSEIKRHHISQLEPNKPYDIWLYTQTNLHVLVRLQDNITCSEIGSDQRRKVQIVSQRGNAITIGRSIPGTDPSPIWRSRQPT